MTGAESAWIILLGAIAAGGIGALRNQFGGPENARAVEETGSRKDAEDGLDARQQRVEGFRIRPLTSGERARFAESWRRIEAGFAESCSEELVGREEMTHATSAGRDTG